jgi:TolB-like protein/class 3 adenylate cyclase/Tfp pilus assembly protein PilF
MADEGFKRKLTAILSADVVDYSRLMGDDEESTVRTLKSYREVLYTLIQQHNGKVLDSQGDNLLAEFVSVVDAVQCAVAVQKEIKARNDELPENRRMQFRVGINLGDVIQEEGRIYGDGVNIAARLEGLDEPGGICISKTAFDHIESKLPYGYDYLGDQTVKNISKPVGAYRVLMDPRVTVSGKTIDTTPPINRRRSVIVGVAAVLAVVIAVGIWQFYSSRVSIVAASVEKMAFPLPDKPSIAVLPFDNMSKDAEQDFLVDAISENIISTLSQIPDLFVIARNSTFTYKGKPVKIAQVSEELGVRYVLEGSVLKSEDRIRITVQLIDALKGQHLWADTYDRDNKDILIIMDDISLEIAKALSVQLIGIDTGKRTADTKSLEAWLLYVRGLHFIERNAEEDVAMAVEVLERAIELDPNLTKAWTQLAFAKLEQARYGYTSSREESFKQAENLAQKSLEMDDSLSETHILLGDMYLYQGHYDEALTEYEKAVALTPNDAFAYWTLGRSFLFIGQPDRGIPLLKKAMRLCPYYPWYFPYVLGRVYYHSRRYDDAIAIFEQIIEMCKERGCSLKWPNVQLAQVYAELGQYEKARSHMQIVLEHDHKFNLESRRKANPYKNSADNDREIEALRKAGAPEHPPS